MVLPELSLTGYELDAPAITVGGSAIWKPGGVLVAQAGPEPGVIVRATLI